MRNRIERSVRFGGIWVGLCVTSLAACALPDYQPPPLNNAPGGAGGTGGSSISAGGAGGTDAVGTGGMGAGGTNMMDENCTNGADDNGDGKADCQDPTCQATHECIPPIPPGFEGPFWARQDPFGNGLLPCPGGDTPIAWFNAPKPAACAECNCTLTGGTCTAGSLDCWDQTNCMGNNHYQIPFLANGCNSIPGAALSCLLAEGPQLVTMGTCAVTGGELVGEPFANQLAVCPMPDGGGGCTLSGATCAVKGTAGYEDLVCIRSPDENAACPVGFNDVGPILATNGYTDNRKCGGCGCNASAQFCEGVPSVIPDGQMGCVSPNLASPLGTQCTSFGGAIVSVEVMKTPAPKLQQGACIPSSGSGLIKPDELRTYCCRHQTAMP